MKEAIAILLSVSLMSSGAPMQAVPPAREARAAQTVSAGADYAGAFTMMNDPGFWAALLENPDEVLMTPQEIDAFSTAVPMTEGTNCVNLDTFAQTLTREELLEYIRAYGVPSGQRYMGETALDAAYYTTLFENRGEASVRTQNAVRYGVVVANTQLRTFPTWDVSYGAPNDLEFDLNCETVLKVCERVLVLHESADAQWYLVQSFNYLGWVPAENVGIADVQAWNTLEQGNFWIVTDNRVALRDDPAREVTMGTRLPALDATTHGFARFSYPVRRADGALGFLSAELPTNTVSSGYLPYTQRNVLTQAFKMLGDRYGWSGLWDSRDCSSFVMDIYACFGIHLPRNANHQAAVAGIRSDTSAMTDRKKTELLLGSPAGTLLEMRGHIMLYLGDYGGKPYAIHAVYSFLPQGSSEVNIANRVLVSDLDILRTNGQTFLKAIRVVNTIDTANP